ncbi:MAG: hypothetical protein PUB32_06640 [Clostridiales bacterium]|nr:hypothetical protein [Clostridiales bacterium]
MGCYISEPLVPEDGDSLLHVHCRKYRYKKDCTNICSQTIYRAACRGRSTAQLLKAEAERLLNTISHVDDVHYLLNSDVAFECVLSNALRTEMSVLDELRAQTTKRAL